MWFERHPSTPKEHKGVTRIINHCMTTLLGQFPIPEVRELPRSGDPTLHLEIVRAVGRGRTGTVVCCWLIRHGLAAPDQAVKKMHALIGDRIQDFIPTPENDQQRLFVEQWCTGQ
jgi:hypothetical protein